tara:strand:+ start:27 stop:215 length:189 start_codon:yes stop_codon:yes gene_type:complete
MINYIKTIFVESQLAKSLSWSSSRGILDLTITGSEDEEYFIFLRKEEARVLAEELMNFANSK